MRHHQVYGAVGFVCKFFNQQSLYEPKTKHLGFFVFGGIAQLVERLLCKQDVAGSNPVASTKKSWTRRL